MVITSIKKLNTVKYSFLTADGPCFFLTGKELSEYGLKPLVDDVLSGEQKADELDINLPDEVFERIREETIIPRGKEYALSLLSERDYTEKKLTEKLRTTGYDENDQAIILAFVKENRFLDDLRFAKSYIRTRCGMKSRRYIMNKLYEKGISSEVAAHAFEMMEEELSDAGSSLDEQVSSALDKQLALKLSSADPTDRDAMVKITASLVRKGFSYDQVKKAISRYYNE